MSLKLFYITAQDDNDDDRSLFVEAGSAADAQLLWSQWLIDTEVEASMVTLKTIFEVPSPTGARRYFNWFDDVKEAA